MNDALRPQSGVAATPAHFISSRAHIPDFHYVEDESSEVIKCVQRQLVWAHRLTQQPEPLFSESLLLFDRAVDKAVRNTKKKAKPRPAGQKMEQRPMKPQPARRDEKKRRITGGWTEENIVLAIQLWAEEHDGQPPSWSDWEKASDYWPSKFTVSKRIGWREALKRAGFKPVRRSTKVPRQEALRLRQQGYTVKQIADSLQVGYGSVRHALRELGAPSRPQPRDLRKRSRQQRIADLQKAMRDREEQTD